MRNRLLPLLAVLPLLACTPAGDKADSGEAIARDAGVGDGPTGRVGSPVAKGANKGPIPHDINKGIEPAPENVTNSAANLLPPPGMATVFQGRWGLTANDCQPGRSDAKGLLVIEPRRLTFYESRATLKNVVTSDFDKQVTANFAFTGEGMSWERRISFERNGDKLRRIEKGGEEGPVDLTYTACPAL
ncbi:hypothetical protein [Sphingomonas humi]|uniref:Lipoprotein n=1 Tax=Sphingomonas humi TaxID=335630 RepID=A0ABP7S4S7_9SPHN